MTFDATRVDQDTTSMQKTLAVYQRDLGDDTATMLVNMFREDTDQLVQALPALAKNQDREMLRKNAHKLKGSFAQMGANYTADLCFYLERGAKEEAWTDLEAGIQSLTRAWQVLLNQLESP